MSHYSPVVRQGRLTKTEVDTMFTPRLLEWVCARGIRPQTIQAIDAELSADANRPSRRCATEGEHQRAWGSME